jgi:hypothetical protein
LAQDCATVKAVWQKMGKNPLLIQTNCCISLYEISCSPTRVISIYWAGKSLKNTIPTEFGLLTGLQRLDLSSNQLTGSIPSVLGSLSLLTSLILRGNQLSGPIPSNLGNLLSLQFLDLPGNQLSGSIPSSLGSLKSLSRLDLSSNQLTGSIPSSLGSLKNVYSFDLRSNKLTGSIPSSLGNLTGLNLLYLSSNQLTGAIPSFLGSLTGLSYLYLHSNKLTGSIPSSLGNLNRLVSLFLQENQLTGYPSTLRASLTLTIFPNPMSNIPYDKVTPASIGTLSGVTWTPFLNSRPPLTKRQALSIEGGITVDSLIQQCPLNNVQGADVAAGCIAGIYNKFCLSTSPLFSLAECQRNYNQAFGASIFQPLGDVCPAWKFGPRSTNCGQAITAFKYSLEVAKDPLTGAPIYVNLNATHAGELVKSIFSNRNYAPCTASTCKW